MSGVSRRTSLAALALSLAAGTLLRFHLPVPEPLRDAAGGAAYVVAAALALLLIAPRLEPCAAAALGFALTCAIEFSQLFSHPWLDAIRATRLGRLALGSTFAWSDFGPYIVGGISAWTLIQLLPRHELS